MEKASKETVAKFDEWLEGMELRMQQIAWSPSHTQVACQFAEELLRQDHLEIRYRIVRDRHGDVISAGRGSEDA